LDGLFEDIEAKHELEAKVANHEAKVAKLEAKVANHEAKVAKLEAKVANHEAKVAKLEAKVEQLRGTITVLGDDKSNLKQQMRSLQTKLFFTNSGLERSRCLALSCMSV
jgi:chromosome segregation ATPase